MYCFTTWTKSSQENPKCIWWSVDCITEILLLCESKCCRDHNLPVAAEVNCVRVQANYKKLCSQVLPLGSSFTLQIYFRSPAKSLFSKKCCLSGRDAKVFLHFNIYFREILLAVASSVHNTREQAYLSA